MVFAKLAFLNKLGKSLDFRDILGSPNQWKLVKISMQTCYWNAVWIFIKIWWFSPNFDLQSATPKSLKIFTFGASRIDLASIWYCKVESGWILTGLGSIFHWFWIDFGCISDGWNVAFANNGWMNNMHLLLHSTSQFAVTLIFLYDIWCGGLRTALGIN